MIIKINKNLKIDLIKIKKEIKVGGENTSLESLDLKNFLKII